MSDDIPSVLTAAEREAALATLPGWQYDLGALHTVYEVPSAAGALALIAAIGATAERQQHHPDVDWRYQHVFIRSSTHSAGGDVTTRDVELATAISAAAAAAQATARPELDRSVELGIDTRDAGAVAAVWREALGYRPVGEYVLVDPWRRGPQVWFQETDRPDPSRIHVDVTVAADRADPILTDVVAAGGRRIDERFRPAWTVVADEDGNRLCICTNLGRD